MVQKTPGLTGDQAKERLKNVQGHIVLQQRLFLKKTLTVTGKYRVLSQPIKGEREESDFDRIC